MPRDQSYRFGPFRFDPATGELVGPDGADRLQPQPAAVLALLLERAGTLVTREELQARVWPDTKVEFDQGINFCIRQIRAALGERADAPTYIETLPRRGYRFLAAVEGRGVTDVRAGTAGGAGAKGWGTGAAGPVVAVAAAIVLIAGVGRVASTGPEAVSSDDAPVVRVAVLPLTDPGGIESELDAFNRSLGEALVVTLATEPGRVAVIGPVTTGPRLAEGRSPEQLAEDLEVAYVVSGGARSEDRTVFLQVVRRRDGAHVLARRLPIEARTPMDLAETLGRQALSAIGRPLSR